MKKHVAYMGWLGHDNIGDEACFYSISQCLLHAQLDCWDIGPWKKQKLPDLSIVGGGTLLDLGFDTRAKSIAALQDEGVPTVFWGTGVLPCRNPMAVQTKNMLEKAEFIGVRGPQSVQLLQANGITKAKVIGDPALLLPRPKKVLGKNSKIVAVNIGDARGRMLGTEQFVVDQITVVVRSLVAAKYTVILFSMWPSDEKYIGKVCCAAKVRKFNASIPALLDFFANCYCVIGMKLHAIVLSAVVGIPFISLAYREKCFDFAESLGLERWAVATNDLKLAEKIQMLFFQLNEQYTNITKQMSLYIEKYKIEHQNTAAFVNQLTSDEFSVND